VVGTSYFFYVFNTLRTGPDLATPIPPIQRLAGVRPLQKEERGDSGTGPRGDMGG
jgi:hypothetical protein